MCFGQDGNRLVNKVLSSLMMTLEQWLQLIQTFTSIASFLISLFLIKQVHTLTRNIVQNVEIQGERNSVYGGDVSIHGIQGGNDVDSRR